MKSSDYMKYCDINYSGDKYRAVTFSSYRPYLTGCTSTDLNTYQDDNGYYINNVYYFKYEPIEWQVIDPYEGFVLCNNIIDSQAYQNYVYKNYDEHKCYNSKSCTNYASDWETSSLRFWLNNSFYNIAFSDEEKSQIGVSHLVNKSAYSSAYDSADTYDKIFLLSIDDTTKSSYGFASSGQKSITRQAKSTDYAQCQGCYTDISPNDQGGSYWWLRTNSKTSGSDAACIIFYNGTVGAGGGSVNFSKNGIRPVFKFNPKSSIPEIDVIVTTNGGGTVSNSASVTIGDEFTITAYPNEGYIFNGWYDGEDLVCTDREFSFVAKQNITLTAKFDAYGDINNDGKRNSSDALLTLQASTGIIMLTDKQQLLADVNKDTKINSSDALLILQYSTGIITKF